MHIKHVMALAALAALPVVTLAETAQTETRSPVVIELFTSEGCSSCPPADEWVRKIDALQPVPGAQVIVMSEHVDYWDHDGWKDPYSSPQMTERQRAYDERMGKDDVYTPQLLLDGVNELYLNDPKQVADVIRKDAAARILSVQFNSAGIDPGGRNILRGHVSVSGGPEKVSGNVYIAVALDHAESHVLAGENGGRRLMHVAVVEDLEKVGKMEDGRGAEYDFQMKLRHDIDPSNLRIIAFVQETGPGRILGATMQRGLR